MKQKGFTLIELLVVIAIIGVLASLTIANYNGAQGRARDAQRKNDLKVVRDALEQRRIDNGAYPTSGGSGPTTGQFTTVAGTLVTAGYLRAALVDPRNGTTPFGYYYFSDGNTYTLRACLENANDTQGTWTSSSCGNTTGAAGSGNRTYTVVNP